MEPIRHIIRHKKATVQFYEAEATHIDHERRIVRVEDKSDIKGGVSTTEIPFDYLVVGVGAENATFGETDLAREAAELHPNECKVFPVLRSMPAS